MPVSEQELAARGSEHSGIRPLVLAFYLPAMMITLGSGLLVPILPLYASSFEISYGLIGLILAGEGLGTLIADVPTGMLQRRFGNKQVMMMGMGFTTVSVALLFVTQSIWLVFLLRLTAGFGRAMYTVSAHVYVTNNIEIGQRGKAISMYGGTHRLGGFVGPAVGGVVASLVGLRFGFLCCGLFSVIGLLCISVFTRNRKGLEPRSAGKQEHPLHVISVLQSNYRILASAGTAQVFAQMIRAGRTVVIPIFAADVLGLGVEQIGLVVSISVAVDFSLFLVAGWLMDHFGRKFAIVPCFAILALGMALIPLTASFGGLLFAAIVIGLGNGLGAGSMMTLGSDLSPIESRGEFLGVWRLIGDFGHTGAPLVVGAVADILVLSSAVWVIALSGVAAASIFLLFVPETLKRARAIPSPT